MYTKEIYTNEKHVNVGRTLTHPALRDWVEGEADGAGLSVESERFRVTLAVICHLTVLL